VLELRGDVRTRHVRRQLDAAIELAIGTALVPGAGPPKKIEERMTEALDGYEEPSEQELDRIGREMDARNARCQRHPLAEQSYDYCVAARRWLDKHPDPPEGQAPAALGEAFEIVRWDCFLIHVKTKRALRGRDEDPLGRFWKSRVQNVYLDGALSPAGDPQYTRAMSSSSSPAASFAFVSP